MRILAQLDVPTRLAALATCRAWRALRGEVELWRDVQLNFTKKRNWLDGNNLTSFLTKGPLDAAAIHSLTLGGDGGVTAWQLAAALKIPLPGLRKIRLYGDKVRVQAVENLLRNVRNTPPHGAAAVQQYATRSHARYGDATDAAGRQVCMPQLTHISFQPRLLRPWQKLESLVAAAKNSLQSLHTNGSVSSELLAALGCAPHLTELRLSMLDVDALRTLGAFAPALEVLVFTDFSPKFSYLGDRVLTEASDEPFAQLPALRSAVINELGVSNCTTLARFLSAAPALRTLEIGGGAGEEVSLGTVLAGEPQAGAPPLQQLTHLTLKFIVDTPAAVAAAGQLPALTALTLDRCGKLELRAAAAVASIAPRLRSLSFDLLYSGTNLGELSDISSRSLKRLHLGLSFYGGYGSNTRMQFLARRSRELAAALREVEEAGELPALRELTIVATGLPANFTFAKARAEAEKAAAAAAAAAAGAGAAAAAAAESDGEDVTPPPPPQPSSTPPPPTAFSRKGRRYARAPLRVLRLLGFTPDVAGELLHNINAPDLWELWLTAPFEHSGNKRSAAQHAAQHAAAEKALGGVYAAARRRCPLLPARRPLLPEATAVGEESELEEEVEEEDDDE